MKNIVKSYLNSGVPRFQMLACRSCGPQTRLRIVVSYHDIVLANCEFCMVLYYDIVIILHRVLMGPHILGSHPDEARGQERLLGPLRRRSRQPCHGGCGAVSRLGRRRRRRRYATSLGCGGDEGLRLPITVCQVPKIEAPGGSRGRPWRKKKGLL